MNKQNISSPKTTFFIALLMLITAHISQAQQYHTLYWMQGIPQSSYSNPGLQPNPNYYVGLPGLSSIYTGLTNTGFAIQDLLRMNTEGKLYIDDQNLISKLRDRNYFEADFNVDILSFGFRMKEKNYLSFSIAERVENRFGYSKDFIRLMVEGNDAFRQEGVTASIGAPSVDLSHYREYAFGFSRKWTSEISAGVRAKILQGMSNVHFKKTEFDVFTGMDNYELLLRSNLLINKSFPVQLAPLEDMDPDFDFTDDDIVNYLTNTGNLGFAVDLGGVYELDEQFTFALSVKDLGFIHWKQDVENFSATGEFEFSGIEFEDFFNSDEEEEEEDSFTQITDSIIDLFDIQETTNAYNLMTTPKIFVSAAYNLTSMHKFAILGKGEIYAGTLYPSLTVSYNFQPINRFGSTLSYSIIHGSYQNVGFGFHVNIFPVQIYMVADNFIPALQPHTFQHFNFHFGVNIAAGWSKQNAAPSYRW